MTSAPPRGTAPDLPHRLERWEAAGLISHDQGMRILALEAEEGRSAAPGGAPRRVAVLGEALGYVGAALVAAAIAFVMGPRWADLAAGVRVGLLFGGAVATLLIGVAVAGTAPAAQRVRAVLWALSAGFLGAGVAVALASVADWRAGSAALLGAALALPYAGFLWWRSRRIPLHLATFAAWLVSAALLGDTVDGGHTVAVLAWLGGVAWCGVAALHRLPPRRLGIALGMGAALVATEGFLDAGWGEALGVATVVGVLAAAVAARSIDGLVIGAVGAFLVVPRVADRLLGGPVGAGVGLLVVGAVLLGAAVVVLRGRRGGAKGR